MFSNNLERLCEHFGAAFAVDGAGNDAACIACALATGIKALQGNMVQQHIVTGNTQWR